MKASLIFFSILSAAQAIKRIIGGSEVSIESYPYQVSIFVYNSFSCGGTIIDHKTIITAAHSAGGNPKNPYTIRAGSASLNSGGIIVNPVKRFENDISIIKLAQNLTYGPGIQPISLPPREDGEHDFGLGFPATGEEVVISGWGSQSESGALSQTLRAVTVTVVNQTECDAGYEKYGMPITEGMFCAGVPEGGKGSCYGDSGGPVVVDGVLAGIVSWGRGCARPGYPTVYTRVSHYRDWIAELTGI
ncbi:trypsin-like serine protease [Aspergillus granulosus]|uniref:Trypsin-like serine protease n=1 Tax=Aspergillus granulosus TaxID=176169 RepID=A0ABR4HNT0_9EURO